MDILKSTAQPCRCVLWKKQLTSLQNHPRWRQHFIITVLPRGADWNAQIVRTYRNKCRLEKVQHFKVSNSKYIFFCFVMYFESHSKVWLFLVCFPCCQQHLRYPTTEYAWRNQFLDIAVIIETWLMVFLEPVCFVFVVLYLFEPFWFFFFLSVVVKIENWTEDKDWLTGNRRSVL